MAYAPGLEKVRFVQRDSALVARVLEQPAHLSPAEMSPPIDLSAGADCWIAQTFVHLRRLGAPVRLASRLSPRAINVVHYDDLPGWKRAPFWAFLVTIQADRARPGIADLRVVQNELCVREPSRDHFMPLWPQAGLRPRDPRRRRSLSRLAYFGLEIYMPAELGGAAFRARLAELGVELAPRYRPELWSDYRDVDAVLAIREASAYGLSIKPASKLVNAWRAGALPIMGPEPAYRQIGRPGVDYLEVRSADEAVGALRWLRERPDEADRLRASGARAGRAYSDAEIARRWIELLEAVALPAFERWSGEGPLRHLLGLPGRLAAHRREIAYFRANI